MIKQAEIKLANLIQALVSAHSSLGSINNLTGEDLEDELRSYSSIFSDISFGLSDLDSLFSTLANTQQEINANKPLSNDYKIFEKVRSLHSISENKKVELMEALQS